MIVTSNCVPSNDVLVLLANDALQIVESFLEVMNLVMIIRYKLGDYLDLYPFITICGI